MRQRGETNTVVSQVTHLPAPLDTEPKIYSAQRRIVLATGLCYVLNVTVWKKQKKQKQTNSRFIVTKYCYCQNAFFPSLRVTASQQRRTQAGVSLNHQCEGAYLVISPSLLIVCFDLKMKKWHYRHPVQIYNNKKKKKKKNDNIFVNFSVQLQMSFMQHQNVTHKAANPGTFKHVLAKY